MWVLSTFYTYTAKKEKIFQQREIFLSFPRRQTAWRSVIVVVVVVSCERLFSNFRLDLLFTLFFVFRFHWLQETCTLYQATLWTSDDRLELVGNQDNLTEWKLSLSDVSQERYEFSHFLFGKMPFFFFNSLEIWFFILISCHKLIF